MASREFWALLIQESTRMVSMLMRGREMRPRQQAVPREVSEASVGPGELTIRPPAREAKQLPSPSLGEAVQVPMGSIQAVMETPKSAKSFEGQPEQDYLWECCSKHLGVTVGTLKEALDRAVDTGMGDKGVTEKVRQAMVSLNAMEPDVEKMIHIPEVREAAEFMQSGQRNFRKAVWEAGLERGQGATEDLRAAHKWATILLDKSYEMATKHPGETCQRTI